MLLDRLRIRGKLALLLVPPLLGMVALTVPVIVGRVQIAERADDTAATARLAGQVGSLIQELQQERLLSVGYLIYATDRNRLVVQSATVADMIAELRETEEPLPREVRAALDGLPPLASVRAGVLNRHIDPVKAMGVYGTEITGLINALRLTHQADTTTSEGQQILALDSVLRADEGVSTVAPYILLMAATKDIRLLTQYAVIYSNLLKDVERFQLYATAEQRALYDLVQQASLKRASQEFLTGLATNPVETLAQMDAGNYFPTVESLITLGRFVEKKIISDVVAGVSERQQRALTEAYAVGLLCLLVLLLVALLSVAVARAVARPLTRLTRSADRVAQVAEAELTKVADGEIESTSPIRLDPVDTRGRDEVGDLARAFDRVQGTAAGLVERQVASRRNVAQMFGHVGRRTQNLVGRQLALIDRLERQEADPARLQHLYQLDHISSRLRRSASSLVVLSGSTGSDSHVAPLPLADVVRLALGEIEDYTRVDVRVPADLAVAPAVIGDLVLALAELMENATTFSPPHTRVTVTAVVAGPGVRLLVVDRGLGMTPERMADENARLAHRERLDLVPTEVLGLFVVGRLARRHGLRVVLTPSAGGGVTAEVEVPERLLVVDVAEARVVAVARARVGSPDALVVPPQRALPGPAAPPVIVPPGPPVAAPVTPAAPAGPGFVGPAPAASPVGPVVGPAGKPVVGPTPAASPAGPVVGPAGTPVVVPVAATAAATAAAASSAAPAGAPVAAPSVAPPGAPAGAPVVGAAARAAAAGAGTPSGPAPEWPIRPRTSADSPAGDEPAAPAAEPARAEVATEPVDVDADLDPAPAAYDEAAFSRAKEMIGSGQPWNAFVPQPRTTPENKNRLRNGDDQATERPATDGGGLRQRVPGAQLPPRGGRRNRITRPPAPDPVEAKALVEQFQAGVADAERHVRAAAPVAPTAKAPTAATAAATATATTTAPRVPTATPTPAANGGNAPLRRRQPGATLETTTATTEPSTPEPPLDADEARDLVQEFEAGVARAMRHIGAGHPDEEESPR